MKPFDLEAAKRGEQITNSQKDKLDFMGVKRNGDIVVEYVSGQIGVYEPRHLCMAPKKRTVWVNLYGHSIASYFDTQEEADKSSCGVRIGKAYPMEIEE